MTPRRLVPIVVDGTVETAQKVRPPRIGEIVRYSVSFSEATEYTDPDDPTTTTISVQIEAARGPYRNERLTGTPFEQRPRWSSVLRGDGWGALWVSFRPPPTDPGPIELRGRLITDFDALCPCWIRGRVSRLWMTAARRDRPVDSGDPATWEPAWGSHSRIMMDELPTAGSERGWPALPPGANESGVLAELDLDDVPDGITGGTRPP